MFLYSLLKYLFDLSLNIIFLVSGARRHRPDVCQRVREEPSNSKPNHDPGSHPEHGQEREQEKQRLTDCYRIGN